MVLTSAAFFFVVVLQLSAGTYTANCYQRENVQFKAFFFFYNGQNVKPDLLGLSIISTVSCLDPVSQAEETTRFVVSV